MNHDRWTVQAYRAHVPEREDGFTDVVIEAARRFGWMAYHARPARTLKGWRTLTQGDKGWPDVVLCRPPSLIIAELKSARGILSDDQHAWRACLIQIPGVEYYVWKPSDWPVIEARLRGG